MSASYFSHHDSERMPLNPASDGQHMTRTDGGQVVEVPQADMIAHLLQHGGFTSELRPVRETGASADGVASHCAFVFAFEAGHEAFPVPRAVIDVAQRDFASGADHDNLLPWTPDADGAFVFAAGPSHDALPLTQMIIGDIFAHGTVSVDPGLIEHVHASVEIGNGSPIHNVLLETVEHNLGGFIIR
jgi:hypothetical protein